ncbi:MULTISPECIES: hypothetical protein [Moorena]|uniref:Uncharacterized protein n=1 Tax=Moorena producens 3L TaxID=489825 RepID=F4XQA3_9CYAN|nr:MULTISPECIES: hypothetical protein [Moorena]NEQ04901.1 hypothetical protein [Moorena sp. SIO4E2]EGJ33245.1 hypothetical protein LYNGBM3L_39950 [Moorena producens 3L]NEP35863.1 hypothetical protein [Moorena sp. SIO3B2]NEP68383.1 hypothetical protein [Moorena sp. SIO3A5]NER86207.1 hypothetical protein [Moorena sp. SIO3A2]
MKQQSRFRHTSLLKFCTTQLAIAGLVTLGIPNGAATAGNQFSLCAKDLKAANITSEIASQACSEALQPEDLSLCVLKIKVLTSLAGQKALGACTRVRRPLELASCVVDIDNKIENINANSVLDHCRRSLLPEQFSECVIGLNSANVASPDKALNTCISVNQYPSQLSPTFAPPPARTLVQ